MVWRVKEKHTHEFLLFDQYVTLMHEGRIIIKINLRDGGIIDSFKCKDLMAHWHITDSMFLTYWVNKRLALIDSQTMEVVKEYDCTDLRTHMQGQLCLTWARFVEGQIIVHGFENIPGRSLDDPPVQFEKVLGKIYS